MSALETDLNPNTYIGLSFPLRRDKFHDFALTKNSLQQARHNLKNLLLNMSQDNHFERYFEGGDDSDELYIGRLQQ